MLIETLEKVRHRWEIERLGAIPPPNEAQIEAQLRKLGVKPSCELVEVFSTLNGFDDGEMDSECFGFWSLNQMVGENAKGDWVKDKSYVHFADFLIFSHTYAIKQNDSLFVSIYCHYAPDYIVKIADSFEEFFGYYLHTDQKLWPG